MKKMLPLPSKESLSERLNYDPESGKLFWKHADRKFFKNSASWKKFNQEKAGEEAGHRHKGKNGKPHAIVLRFNIGGKSSWFLAHRVIYALMGLEIPLGMEVDHANRNPWDNRWVNLRLATPSQNCVNRGSPHRKTNHPIIMPKGVSLQAGRYKAQIAEKGLKRHIGLYGTIEEAALAYRDAAMPLHKEFFCQPMQFPKRQQVHLENNEEGWW